MAEQSRDRHGFSLGWPIIPWLWLSATGVKNQARAERDEWVTRSAFTTLTSSAEAPLHMRKSERSFAAPARSIRSHAHRSMGQWKAGQSSEKPTWNSSRKN